MTANGTISLSGLVLQDEKRFARKLEGRLGDGQGGIVLEMVNGDISVAAAQ